MTTYFIIIKNHICKKQQLKIFPASFNISTKTTNILFVYDYFPC